jgi:hypothetical protein
MELDLLYFAATFTCVFGQFLCPDFDFVVRVIYVVAEQNASTMIFGCDAKRKDYAKRSATCSG